MAPAIPFMMLAMAAVGSATSIYQSMSAPEAPSPPDTSRQNEQAVAAAQAQAQFLNRRRGFPSTILTGPQGVSSQGQTGNTTLG